MIINAWNSRQKKQGSVLIIGIIFLVLLTLVASVMLMRSRTNQQQSGGIAKVTDLKSAADNAMEMVGRSISYWWNPNLHGTTTVTSPYVFVKDNTATPLKYWGQDPSDPAYFKYITIDPSATNVLQQLVKDYADVFNNNGNYPSSGWTNPLTGNGNGVLRVIDYADGIRATVFLEPLAANATTGQCTSGAGTAFACFETTVDNGQSYLGAKIVLNVVAENTNSKRAIRQRRSYWLTAQPNNAGNAAMTSAHSDECSSCHNQVDGDIMQTSSHNYEPKSYHLMRQLIRGNLKTRGTVSVEDHTNMGSSASLPPAVQRRVMCAGGHPCIPGAWGVPELPIKRCGDSGSSDCSYKDGDPYNGSFMVTGTIQDNITDENIVPSQLPKLLNYTDVTTSPDGNPSASNQAFCLPGQPCGPLDQRKYFVNSFSHGLLASGPVDIDGFYKTAAVNSASFSQIKLVNNSGTAKVWYSPGLKTLASGATATNQLIDITGVATTTGLVPGSTLVSAAANPYGNFDIKIPSGPTGSLSIYGNIVVQAPNPSDHVTICGTANVYGDAIWDASKVSGGNMGQPGNPCPSAPPNTPGVVNAAGNLYMTRSTTYVAAGPLDNAIPAGGFTLNDFAGNEADMVVLRAGGNSIEGNLNTLSGFGWASNGYANHGNSSGVPNAGAGLDGTQNLIQNGIYAPYPGLEALNATLGLLSTNGERGLRIHANDVLVTFPDDPAVGFNETTVMLGVTPGTTKPNLVSSGLLPAGSTVSASPLTTDKMWTGGWIDGAKFAQMFYNIPGSDTDGNGVPDVEAGQGTGTICLDCISQIQEIHLPVIVDQFMVGYKRSNNNWIPEGGWPDFDGRPMELWTGYQTTDVDGDGIRRGPIMAENFVSFYTGGSFNFADPRFSAIVGPLLFPPTRGVITSTVESLSYP